jgi:hypothetical protein
MNECINLMHCALLSLYIRGSQIFLMMMAAACVHACFSIITYLMEKLTCMHLVIIITYVKFRFSQHAFCMMGAVPIC